MNCSLRIASPLAISDDLLDTDWFVHDTFWSFSLCSVLLGTRETDRHKKKKFHGQSCLYQGLQASLTKIILFPPILTSDCVNYALKRRYFDLFEKKLFSLVYFLLKFKVRVLSAILSPILIFFLFCVLKLKHN